MEFLDEFESKPRFVFQSKQLPQPHDSDALHPSSSLHKPTIFISLSFSIFTFILALFYLHSEPLKSFLLWLSLSLLVGPFAPSSITAGDIRVGLGPPLKETLTPNETAEKPNRKSTRITPKKPSEDAVKFDGYSDRSSSVDVDFIVNKRDGSSRVLSETKSEEWSEGDDELLKKLMGKHPPGKPGRWEAIAEGFKGKHGVETVIAKAKEAGDKKANDRDSFQKFLKDRKPVDNRVLDDNVEEGGKVNLWTSAEDLALLNALKAFPKDVAMRWEKIAASVPGKTKSACMKRVGELKKDFRSSKAQTSTS